jgi:four helix bundle suffix protein
MENDGIIAKHGGYKKLLTWQLAELLYDLTVHFCNRYISLRSRTHDQMVQAARSGSRNIAEGSQMSGTSKKMEMKLTGVARGSLEELRKDYASYLRQRGLQEWPPQHPVLLRFKSRRYHCLDDVRRFVEEERSRTRDMDAHGRTRSSEARSNAPSNPLGSMPVHDGPGSNPRNTETAPMPTSGIVANVALSLLNLCCYLLERQLTAQAAAFEREGGFTERLYRNRQKKRNCR